MRKTIMPKKWILAASLVTLLASPANAARTFAFSYLQIYGALIYGNVNFTTGDAMIDVDGRAALLVTGISGDRGGVAITGLVPSFPQQYDGADNYLFPDVYPPFSSYGISFSLADGLYVNLYSDEDTPYEYLGAECCGR